MNQCEICKKQLKEKTPYQVKKNFGRFCSLKCARASPDRKRKLNTIELLGDFTEFQKQIIIGTLLGDGNLSKPKNGVNYHLTVAHSEKQLEYLNYKLHCQIYGVSCSFYHF